MTDVVVRRVDAADLQACLEIEEACFSESEAASEEKIRKRGLLYPDGFLVAEIDGVVVGFVNSGATDDPDLSNEEFKDLEGHDPDGRNIVILSIAVSPGCQGQGISRPLMTRFIEQSRWLGKKKVLLLCKRDMIPYYEKFGFSEVGASSSTHGGSRWHEMHLVP